MPLSIRVLGPFDVSPRVERCSRKGGWVLALLALRPARGRPRLARGHAVARHLGVAGPIRSPPRAVPPAPRPGRRGRAPPLGGDARAHPQSDGRRGRRGDLRRGRLPGRSRRPGARRGGLPRPLPGGLHGALGHRGARGARAGSSRRAGGAGRGRPGARKSRRGRAPPAARHPGGIPCARARGACSCGRWPPAARTLRSPRRTASCASCSRASSRPSPNPETRALYLQLRAAAQAGGAVAAPVDRAPRPPSLGRVPRPLTPLGGPRRTRCARSPRASPPTRLVTLDRERRRRASRGWPLQVASDRGRTTSPAGPGSSSWRRSRDPELVMPTVASALGVREAPEPPAPGSPRRLPSQPAASSSSSTTASTSSTRRAGSRSACCTTAPTSASSPPAASPSASRARSPGACPRSSQRRGRRPLPRARGPEGRSRDGGADLPAARRHPARHRARGRADPRALGGADRGAPRRSLPPAHRRQPHGAPPPPHAEGRRRLGLRSSSTEEEQALLRRLSVFAGGCTLEAAEAIAGHDVLDPLASLVDKSLVGFSRPLSPAGDRAPVRRRAPRGAGRDRALARPPPRSLRAPRRGGRAAHLRRRRRPRPRSSASRTRTTTSAPPSTSARPTATTGPRPRCGSPPRCTGSGSPAVTCARGATAWPPPCAAARPPPPPCAPAPSPPPAPWPCGWATTPACPRRSRRGSPSRASSAISASPPMPSAAWAPPRPEAETPPPPAPSSPRPSPSRARRTAASSSSSPSTGWAPRRTAQGDLGRRPRRPRRGARALAAPRSSARASATPSSASARWPSPKATSTRPADATSTACSCWRSPPIAGASPRCSTRWAGSRSPRGQPEQGARLLGAASALCELIGAQVLPSERGRAQRALESARCTLGEPAFAAAWAAGRALSMEQAMAQARR